MHILRNRLCFKHNTINLFYQNHVIFNTNCSLWKDISKIAPLKKDILNPISFLVFWPHICSLVKLHPSFKKSKKHITLTILADVNIFNKNTVFFCIFSLLLHFLYFLYYLLSQLTQIPFYSSCKIRQVISRLNNNVK